MADANTPIIYIRGQVTLSDAQLWDLSSITGAIVKRSSLYPGHLVNVVSGEVLTLHGITIDGNYDNVPDSYGNPIPASGINYSLFITYGGISINSTTGVIKITPSAQEGVVLTDPLG